MPPDLPPSESEAAASVCGRIRPKSAAKALLFSMASFARYLWPPTSSRAASTASFNWSVILFLLPGLRPDPGRKPPCCALVSGSLFIKPLFLAVLANILPCLSNLPSGSRLISGFFSSVSIGSVSLTTSSVVGLCFLVSPSAIGCAVASVIVYSVERHSWRSVSHVCVEVDELHPARILYCDAAPVVVIPGLARGAHHGEVFESRHLYSPFSPKDRIAVVAAEYE